MAENKKKKEGSVVYVKTYIHYRTGKLMIASDYGYVAWAFLSKKKK